MFTLINVLVGLRLQNIALIDSLELTFEKGFTSFTGETGAGKSIFLDSIDLLFGGGKQSATSKVIKVGSNNASIEGCFLKNSAIEHWFNDNQFDCDSDEFFLSRDWKFKDERWSTRFRLNGLIINKQQVLSLRPYLIDFTVQGQVQSLNLINNHSKWIDRFGFSNINPLLLKAKLIWDQWSQAKNDLDMIRVENEKSKNQFEEMNNFLIDLDNAIIEDPLEIIKLEQEQDRLVNGVKLQEGLIKIFSNLKEGIADIPTANDHIASSIQELKLLSSLDNSLYKQLDLAIDLYSNLDNLINSLDQYSLDLNSNPSRLQEIQERILLIKRLEVRYNLSLNDLIIRRNEYRKSILSVNNSIQLDELEKKEKLLRFERDQINVDLTNVRKKVSEDFENLLKKYLRLLCLDNVKFKVKIVPSEPSFKGADDVTFLFSANPDQPLSPLSEIASGGEMSRFLLALKTVLANVEGSHTLIFDEIDSGVSGKISSSIAKLLKELAMHKQVFCVTHQPLVAAMADHHFSVSKSIENGVTRSRVNYLKNFEARKKALADLAGGNSAEARSYAASLLDNKAA